MGDKLQMNEFAALALIVVAPGIARINKSQGGSGRDMKSSGLILVLGVICSNAANATLMNRGGGLIYDSDQDTTWLQDANLAVTNTFGVAGITPDGRMTWDTAADWIAAMNSSSFMGLSAWRLPITVQPDPSCSSQNTGGVDGQGSGFECTGSEMGHLYNVDGISSASPDPFLDVQPGDYWSSSEFAPNTVGAWGFVFGLGIQGIAIKDVSFLFAWPVLSGDVAVAAPEPSIWLLVITGLVFLGYRRRREH